MNASDKARLNQVAIPDRGAAGKLGDSTRGVGDLVDDAIAANNNAFTPGSGVLTVTGDVVVTSSVSTEAATLSIESGGTFNTVRTLAGAAGGGEFVVHPATGDNLELTNFAWTSGVIAFDGGGARIYGAGSNRLDLLGDGSIDLVAGSGDAINLGTPSAGVLTLNGSEVQNARALGADSGVVGGVLNLNVTAVASASAGPNDLITYTLPANSLVAAGRGIRIYAWGTTTNNANAKTLTLNWGGQVVSTQAMTTNEANTWEMEAIVARTGASTQDVMATLTQLTGTALRKGTITAGTQTETSAIIIKCTATNEVTQEGLLVEAL